MVSSSGGCPLARSTTSTTGMTARPVGVHTYGGLTNSQNLTRAKIVVVGLAPVDWPRGVDVAVKLFRARLSTQGYHLRIPKAVKLPVVLPAGSRTNYVVGVTMTLKRPEDAMVWGIWESYW